MVITSHALRLQALLRSRRLWRAHEHNKRSIIAPCMVAYRFVMTPSA